jgi:Na+-driven multidrug efflux pump
MATYALATHACYPGHEPLERVIGGFRFAWPLILALYLITLMLCASAFFVSLRNWRITGSETDGHHQHLIERGEGRTRYLGIIGMSFSVLFFVITAVGAIILAIVPLCTD